MTQTLDRAKSYTATTGTGAVTVGLAVIPYQTWAQAGAANATVYPYLIEDGNAWEEGYGTYTTSGTSLTRTMTASSTGSLLNLSGAATVACVQRSVDGINCEAATVGADESYSGTNNVYVDLATVGPVVTLVTGTSAFVITGYDVYNSTGAGNTATTSIAVSGATTIAAGTWVGSSYSANNANFNTMQTYLQKITGLTPGSNTFTLKYAKDGATWHWSRRSLMVISGT